MLEKRYLKIMRKKKTQQYIKNGVGVPLSILLLTPGSLDRRDTKYGSFPCSNVSLVSQVPAKGNYKNTKSFC